VWKDHIGILLNFNKKVFQNCCILQSTENISTFVVQLQNGLRSIAPKENARERYFCRYASSHMFVSWSTLVSRCCLAHMISHWTPIIQWAFYTRVVRGLLQLFTCIIATRAFFKWYSNLPRNPYATKIFHFVSIIINFYHW